MGCVDLLSFGSESGNLDLLQQAAKAADSPEVQSPIKLLISSGISYPSAREKAIHQQFGPEISGLFRSPNNILAIEYLRALNNFSSSINPATIRRAGSLHDDVCACHSDSMASASYLRQCLLNERWPEIKKFVPEEIFSILKEEMDTRRAPCSLQQLEKPILAVLRKLTPDDLSMLPDVSEGLENRIISAVKDSASLEELFVKIKTKRYTHARIRRIIVSSFLGISQNLSSCLPPYLRVLGFNRRGTEILKTARETATLPIVMRAGDFANETSQVSEISALNNSADNLFALSSPDIQPCGLNFTTGVIKMLS